MAAVSVAMRACANQLQLRSIEPPNCSGLVTGELTHICEPCL